MNLIIIFCNHIFFEAILFCFYSLIWWILLALSLLLIFLSVNGSCIRENPFVKAAAHDHHHAYQAEEGQDSAENDYDKFGEVVRFESIFVFLIMFLCYKKTDKNHFRN